MPWTQRAYYWIGKSLDQYCDNPTPEQARIVAHYNLARIRQRANARDHAAHKRAQRAAQAPYALPDMRALMAAPENTSIHAAACGSGTSWSAHHSKGVDSRRSPDVEGYRARIDQSRPVPRAVAVPRGRVMSTRHVETDFSEAQRVLDEEREAEAYLARMMREDARPVFHRKKFVRFS